MNPVKKCKNSNFPHFPIFRLPRQCPSRAKKPRGRNNEGLQAAQQQTNSVEAGRPNPSTPSIRRWTMDDEFHDGKRQDRHEDLHARFPHLQIRNSRGLHSELAARVQVDAYRNHRRRSYPTHLGSPWSMLMVRNIVRSESLN